MGSEGNLAPLRRGGGRYIVAMQCRKATDVPKKVLAHPDRYEEVREKLKVKEVWIEGRRYVVCFNALEAERQKKQQEEVLKELEEEIRSLKIHPKRACKLFSCRRYGPYLRWLRSDELRLSK